MAVFDGTSSEGPQLRGLWTKAYSQSVDHYTIDSGSKSEQSLMKTAGARIAEVCWPYIHNDHQILVLAGRGHNGGDALIAADKLRYRGLHPKVWAVGWRGGEDIAQLGLALTPKSYEPGLEQTIEPHRPLFVIDGLLGLGLDAELRPGIIMDCLTSIAACNPDFVVAVDLPSGLHPDRWQQRAILAADLTVTFGGFKPCHVLEQSRVDCGAVVVCDIGFARPPEASEPILSTSAVRLGEDPWANLMPFHHKYDRGHILVIGGSEGKNGAVQLAASAARKAGAGWVSIATPDEKPVLDTLSPWEPLFPESTIDWSVMAPFIEKRRVSCLIIGPGTVSSFLSLQDLEQLSGLQQELGLRLVLDAGALHDLGGLLQQSPLDPQSTIVTPHGGEWRKLFSEGNLAPVDSLQELAAAQQYMQEWGLTCFYKGSTPITIPGIVNQAAVASIQGNVGLSKAGSGDVFAGVLGSNFLGLHDPRGACLTSYNQVCQALTRAQNCLGYHNVTPLDLVNNIRGESCR